MNDEELLSQAAGMPTVYVDGFGAFRKLNGVLRCVGFVVGSGAQINLIVSLTGAEAGIADARIALDAKQTKNTPGIQLARLAH